MAKIKLTGLTTYIEQLEKLEADVPHIAESVLKASYGHVTTEIYKALKKGNPLKQRPGRAKPINLKQTNELYDSFYEKARVHWYGKVAEINVGFDQKVSMHATYLMITGNRYNKPHQELYNAIYRQDGKIKKIQTEMYEKAVMEAMK